MSDFVRDALEGQLNANIDAIRAAGFDIAIESEGNAVRYVSVINRIALPALPGPGAETQTITLPPEVSTEREPEKKASAKGRSGGRDAATQMCRICGKKKLRAANETGVCSAWQCRAELKKEAGEKH